MKKILFALAAVLLCQTSNAGQSAVATDPATTINPATTITAPDYTYCEIIANHLPVRNGEGVLFDFGQPTQKWAYNWLQDEQGNKLLFNSAIEALNYMVYRGWEFVQAYTSGEDVGNTHYLLRIPTSRLNQEQQQQFLEQPPHKEPKKSARD